MRGRKTRIKDLSLRIMLSRHRIGLYRLRRRILHVIKGYTTMDRNDCASDDFGNLKKLGLVPDHAVPHDVVVIDREKPKKGQGDDWDSLPEDEKKFSSRTM